MAVLLQDDFDRANSTTSLGSPQVGGPYTVVSGTWGITAGEAYMATFVANGLVTFPAAVDVDISVKQALGSTSSVYPMMLFRYVDPNNFWSVGRVGSGDLGLMRMSAGVLTAVTSNVTSPAGTVVRIRAYGDQIAWYKDGIQQAVITDQWFASAGSLAGFQGRGTATPRFDNLLVQDQLEPLNTWGASPVIEVVDLSILGADLALVPSLYKGRDTAIADESEIP